MTVSEQKILRSKIVHVSVPIIVQNLISALVSSADVFMTGFLGQAAISSLSLASQYSMLVMMLFFGINSAVSVLSSQYWGRHDTDTVEKVQGVAYRYSSAAGLVLFVWCLVFPSFMMRIYTSDGELIALGRQYLCGAAPGFLFWSLSSVYLASLKSIERVAVSTVSESVALAVDVFLNACFIFGFAGFPKIGVFGVGLATSIARFIQFLICLSVSVKSRDVRLRFDYIFRKDPQLAREFRSIVLPTIGSEMSWALGFSMYSVVFGHLGSDVVAANSIVSVMRNLGGTVCWGIGGASGIIVGQYLGAGRIEDGKEAAGKILKLAVLTGLAGGVFILASVPVVLRAVRISETARAYLVFMLSLNSVYLSGTAVNATMISGILRAGGNSRWGFVCDFIGMWCYSVPLAFVSAFVFVLPVRIVYLLICTDEFVKWPFVFRRYRSGRWAVNITRERSK